jgi:hypothetical protein
MKKKLSDEQEKKKEKLSFEGQHTKAVLIETTHSSLERSLYLSM